MNVGANIRLCFILSQKFSILIKINIENVKHIIVNTFESND